MNDLWSGRQRYSWTCETCLVQMDHNPTHQCPSCGALNTTGIIVPPNTVGPPPFRPFPTEWKPMMENLSNDESGERHTRVTFVVGAVRVHAFLFVLQAKSPALAGLVADIDSDDVVEITGEDDPELFKLMIASLYEDYSRDKFHLESQGIPLLRLANRYGCTDLKMHLEADIAENVTLFSVDTAVDILFFADANVCAYLKEQAIHKIINARPLNQTSEIRLQESTELMAEVSGQRTLAHDPSLNHTQLWVAELRQRLADRGLDTDGTREMLVSRLGNE